MKKIIAITWILGLTLALTASLSVAQGPAPQDAAALQAPLGTSFTYQGKLNDGGSPANGSYDFEFGLYDVADGGTALATVHESKIHVTDGLFTVPLDFEDYHFSGDARWLEIGVRLGDSGPYTTLVPRQPLTPAPYALSLRPGATIHNTASETTTFALVLESNEGTGLFVSWAGTNGVRVGEVGDIGVYVHEAGDAGVSVFEVGSPSSMTESDLKNGFEVAGAEGYGLYVGRADRDGVYVNSTEYDGVHVELAGSPSSHASSNGKNGFEVAGAEGNGLYVGRADLSGVTVSSAAGAGLHVTRADDDGVYVGITGDDGVFVGMTGGDGVNVGLAGSPISHTLSDAKNGFEVAGAQGYGLYVGRTDLDGVYVNSTEYDGVRVASAGGDGVAVDSAGWSGIYVASAGGDGVYVHQAGSPSTTSASTLKNGFEVAGAEGHGLYVGQADAHGMNVDWAGNTGVYVDQVGNNGMYVDNAGNDGMYVNHAGGDGVYVNRACSPSTTSADTAKTGFEVAGAEGYGLYVGRADMAGVAVNTAGSTGVYVNQANGHGFEVVAAGVYGVSADTTQASHNYGLYTPDNIYSLNYHLAGATMLVAQSGDSGNLEPGDVVAVSGAGAAFAGGESPVALVRRAGPGSSVMGVVYRRYVAEKKVEEVKRDGKMEQRTSFCTTSTEGHVAPGDYLLVVVLGPAQVKVEAASGADVHPGDTLTAAPNGQAAKATPVKVGEVSFYAPGTVIGQAMGALDESKGRGLVWMLVMPR